MAYNLSTRVNTFHQINKSQFILCLLFFDMKTCRPTYINNKFSSYEELLVFKGNYGNYENYNFIQLYTRTSQTLDYFFKRNPPRKASVNLKYSTIELACIHGGNNLFLRQVEKDQTPGIRKYC